MHTAVTAFADCANGTFVKVTLVLPLIPEVSVLPLADGRKPLHPRGGFAWDPLTNPVLRRSL